MLGYSVPGRYNYERVLCISQSSRIIGASPSDCLVSYPGQSLWEPYSSDEIQSVYSLAAADGAQTGVGVCY